MFRPCPAFAARALVWALLLCVRCCAAEPAAGDGVMQSTRNSGDRVYSGTISLDQWFPSGVAGDSYRIAPGDALGIHVYGRSSLDYLNPNPSAAAESGGPSEVIVSPDGDVYIRLAGRVAAAGKTTSELEDAIRKALSPYIREFDVTVTLGKARTVNVWITGEVENPGPRTFPAECSVSLAVLQAGIKPTGSTRRVTLIRGEDRVLVDLYWMMVTGKVGSDVALESGDIVHVPPVKEYVEIRGECTRPGRYEMLTSAGESGSFEAAHLLELSLGLSPAAALSRCSIERIGSDGLKSAVSVDLSETPVSVKLQSGDVLVVPSIEAYQPIIRLIGEFKGDGVYQRAPGATEIDVENRGGIYPLKQGQSALDVISATGGVTPQADLKHARIERNQGDKTLEIALDLERLIVHHDLTADVELQSGDSLVLPAISDRIHVFGQVRRPGSYVYSPRRRLVDYLSDAGGPTDKAKLADVSVVRGGLESPQVLRLNAESAIRGYSDQGNPELQPGDIVYIREKFISGWRDGVQLIFTSISLANLLGL